MQQENDAKSCSKSISQFLDKNIQINKSSQGFGIGKSTSVEMLWRDFKRGVHKKMLNNLNYLKQGSKEEWVAMT